MVPLTGAASTVEDDPLGPSAQPVAIMATVYLRNLKCVYANTRIESLMSQDEDEVSEQGQKTGRFISHA